MPFHRKDGKTPGPARGTTTAVRTIIGPMDTPPVTQNTPLGGNGTHDERATRPPWSSSWRASARVTTASQLLQASMRGNRASSGVSKDLENTAQEPRCRDIRYYHEDGRPRQEANLTGSTKRRVVAPVLPVSAAGDTPG